MQVGGSAQQSLDLLAVQLLGLEEVTQLLRKVCQETETAST